MRQPINLIGPRTSVGGTPIREVAVGAFDRCCQGSCSATLVNLVLLQAHLLRLALARGYGRAKNQRSLIR
jgi:hypothetical protein